MAWMRIGVALSALNLVILASGLLRSEPVAADDGVLRGRALELVDASGRVRAEVKVLPADPSVKMPDGTTGYPETVLLRLIDAGGGPNVKLAATDDGAGLVLGGEDSYVQVLSRGAHPTIKVVDKDRGVRVLVPDEQPR
jgi:hypothetical protein